ncbi:hypothetical protein [Luedemannella flava]|uniref:hypothetical protein n=1 Tax=Luedemannella flava TaxID=349316 RepID=UPI0031E258DB
MMNLGVNMPPELDFEYKITIVEDERPQYLAAAQAASILEVQEWFARSASTPAGSVQEQDETSAMRQQIGEPPSKSCIEVRRSPT